MELVRGGSLLEYLKSNSTKITDSERLNHMASSAAWGLEYLHSRSCIHRGNTCLIQYIFKKLHLSF